MRLLVIVTVLVGICWAKRGNFRVPINRGHKRGDANFATKPRPEVGKRHHSYRRGVNRSHPFELGVGYYYQFDIMLRPEVHRNAIPLEDDIRWPNAVVPYVISSTFSAANVSIIKSAMDQYAQTTCVRFVPRTSEAEYITIGNGASGCWSYVGRSLDNQYNQVNLQIPSCITTGTVTHELMHALGFYHEFSRPDRDDYVSIDMGALAPKYQTTEFFEANFEKLTPQQAELYGIPYNYGSVMHYSKWGGAVSYSRPVMKNLKPWVGDFGNKIGLATTDVQAVNSMYCKSSAL
ncbi:astacin [Culex quinquefasciatus]|uniref:astacin n=1 Tax=Culex quinquefasciatus TaxID=7176 RepID=UPI0018E3E6F0|nr:astacin [Culex quinquefasciatus]